MSPVRRNFTSAIAGSFLCDWHARLSGRAKCRQSSKQLQDAGDSLDAGVQSDHDHDGAQDGQPHGVLVLGAHDAGLVTGKEHHAQSHRQDQAVEGAGDDEQIVIDLARVPEEYDRIIIVVNIYQAMKRNQHFGMIQNAFIRLVDASKNSEMCRYNLTDDYSGMTAMIFGEVYRHNGEWKFNAIGQGTTDPGLGELVRRYL